MWGIIPAAGVGSRIQPLAFSKELLPVGSCFENGRERPLAVSEYLVQRMSLGGVNKICFVISPGKSDILDYFGGSAYGVRIFYAVQAEARGLCDAVFQAAPLIGPEEPVVVGLPDTVWFPADALSGLSPRALSLLLFPVRHPERFDAVVTGDDGQVIEVQVKDPAAKSNWVWGAFKMPGHIFRELHRQWLHRRDEYFGTLFNHYIATGGSALGVRTGQSYVDVGTVNGYREAVRILDNSDLANSAPSAGPLSQATEAKGVQ